MMDARAKILVVDDDPTILNATRRVLEQAGYETLSAPNGEAALEVTRAQRPDLVLLDVNMPKMDGLEACRLIKADPALAGIFIIIMSSIATDSDSRADGLNMGADGYIARPIANRELLARVQAMLRIQAGERALQVSNAQWSATFDAVSDSIFLTDANYTILKCNQAAAEMWPQALETLVGKKCYQVVHGSETPASTCPLAMVCKTRSRQVLTFAQNERWLEAKVDPMFDTGGNFTGTVHVVADITERKLAEQALRESEDKFKYLFDHSVIGKSITLPSGEMNANRAFAEMLGYSIEELQKRKWQEISHPNDLELTQTEINSLLSNQRESTRFIKRYLHKNGSIIWAEVGTALRRDEDGKPLYFMTSINDITERKQAEDALRESEDKYRRLFENTSLGIFQSTPEGKVISVNQAFARMFGYDSSAEALKSIRNVATDVFADPNRRAEIIRLMAENPDLKTFENVYRRKDESTFIGNLNSMPVKDAHGRLIRLEGLIEDITERKQAEEALRKSETRLRAILDATPFPIALVDVQDDNIDFWSSSALTLFGHTASTAEQWYQMAYPDPEYRQDVIERWKPALEKAQLTAQSVNTGEYKVTCRDGSVRICELYATILADSLIVTFNDITERRQAEEKIRSLNAELEEKVKARTRELLETQEQLVRQEKLAVLGQLAGGVGHELRNPLGIINNAIYYLRMVQPDADETVKEYLGIIETETHTADKIISDLLDFSRIKSVDVEPVIVSDLVQRTLERFPPPENVQVTLNLPDNLPAVYVDPRQITQVLGNLVLNACQAMPKGGELLVSSEQRVENREQGVETDPLISNALIPNIWLLITIKDTGVGITPENMKKLFEPLFTTKPKGIGLGLAVSKKLIEANGGKIEVESEPGKGSTITVWLPVHNVTARVE